MNYSKFSNWISGQINALKLRNPAVTIYLLFLMASSRKHTLTAAARFSDSSKSRFHYFLKNHSEAATYALSELSKKQARQFSKINTGLSTGNLPWNIAISIDATIQHRSSLHEEYIGPYAPEKVVVLADSGYDDQKIQQRKKKTPRMQ